jgi:hypothetical protein
MTLYCQKLLFHIHPHPENFTLKNQSSTFIPKIHILGHLCFFIFKSIHKQSPKFSFHHPIYYFQLRERNRPLSKTNNLFIKFPLASLQSLDNTFHHQICCTNNIYYSLTYLLVFKRRCLLEASRKFGFFFGPWIIETMKIDSSMFSYHITLQIQ